jgi:hypothetical protein
MAMLEGSLTGIPSEGIICDVADTDPFVRKVTSELREMERREHKLQADAERIREQVFGIRRRRGELEKSLAVYQDVMGVGQASSAPDVPEGTIADVAFKVLRELGGPRTVNDLVSELQSLGKLKGGGTSGRADYGTLYQALNRDSRFVRVGRGEFIPAPDAPSAPEQPVELSLSDVPD